MKKIIFSILLIFSFIINIKAEEELIYNIYDEYIYETSDIAFKSNFNNEHDLIIDLLNTKDDLTCEFQVYFYNNNKLIYFNHYETDFNRDNKNYIVKGADYPRKNLVTKYKVEVNCSKYIEDKETNKTEESPILHLTQEEVLKKFFIFMIFDIAAVIFILVIVIKLFVKSYFRRK